MFRSNLDVQIQYLENSFNRRGTTVRCVIPYPDPG